MTAQRWCPALHVSDVFGVARHWIVNAYIILNVIIGFLLQLSHFHAFLHISFCVSVLLATSVREYVLYTLYQRNVRLKTISVALRLYSISAPPQNGKDRLCHDHTLTCGPIIIQRYDIHGFLLGKVTNRQSRFQTLINSNHLSLKTETQPLPVCSRFWTFLIAWLQRVLLHSVRQTLSNQFYFTAL